MRVERVKLKDKSDVAVGGRKIIDALSINEDVAFFRGFQACDESERCRFTAAGGTEKNDEFFVLNFKVKIFDGDDIAETFYDVFKFDMGHNI